MIKAYIIDLSQLSDSREIMEAKPHPFLGWFILILLFIIGIGLAWSYFAVIDEYVKATGIVRPAEGRRIIINEISGKVEEVFFHSGMKVAAGDVLYTLDLSSLVHEFEAKKDQLKQLQQEHANLETLKRSVFEGRNYFIDSNPEQVRFQTYQTTQDRLESIYNESLQLWQRLERLFQTGAVAKYEVDEVRKQVERAKHELEKYRLDSLVQIDDALINKRMQIEQYERELKLVELRLQAKEIVSPIDGIINPIKELYSGDILASGVEIATIVPEQASQFVIELMVPNHEIAKINLGQEISLRFLGLPFREYGGLRGTVETIATDAQFDPVSGISYYLVEAKMEANFPENSDGIHHYLRSGMICEGYIITSSKKLLHWLLGKLDFLN
ncbi:MAG: HlyD family efflux transporter periplasmic adaptor subunit [Firmicutes bacterium]|nr:HlyD family efflux transporter periplasmic adaptor subunit [Bacillota bacterium]